LILIKICLLLYLYLGRRRIKPEYDQTNEIIKDLNKISYSSNIKLHKDNVSFSINNHNLSYCNTECKNLQLDNSFNEISIYNASPEINNKYSLNIFHGSMNADSFKPALNIIPKESKTNNINNTNKTNKDIKTDELFYSLINEVSNLTILSVEIFCNTRKKAIWHYETDEILAIFCVFEDENAKLNLKSKYEKYKVIITTHKDKFISYQENDYYKIKSSYINNEEIEIIQVEKEIDIFTKFIDLALKYDPDLIIGYETEILSIAYICRRADVLGIPMTEILSRKNTSEIVLSEVYLRLKIEEREKYEAIKHERSKGYKDAHEIKYIEQKFSSLIKVYYI